jgi:hypothetical protein
MLEAKDSHDSSDCVGSSNLSQSAPLLGRSASLLDRKNSDFCIVKDDPFQGSLFSLKNIFNEIIVYLSTFSQFFIFFFRFIFYFIRICLQLYFINFFNTFFLYIKTFLYYLFIFIFYIYIFLILKLLYFL